MRMITLQSFVEPNRSKFENSKKYEVHNTQMFVMHIHNSKHTQTIGSLEFVRCVSYITFDIHALNMRCGGRSKSVRNEFNTILLL